MNIDSKPTHPKGNGGERHATTGHRLEHNGKPTIHQLSGCWKNPTGCDSCKIPVDKCTGAFFKGD